MKKTEETDNYAPWANQEMIGFVSFAISCLCGLWLFRTQELNLHVGGVGLASFFTSFFCFQKALSRRRGKRIEKNAIESVNWDGWRVQPNLPCVYGDIDVVLTDLESGTKFAVEIKSITGFFYKKQTLFSKEALLTKAKNKFPKDPIEQTIRNAELIEAVAVLWFPKGKTSFFKRNWFKMKNDLIVVSGNHKNLHSALTKNLR